MATVGPGARGGHGTALGTALGMGAMEPVAPFDASRAGSIWTPRIQWSDGKSLFDTDAALRSRLYVDFRRALQLGVNKLIMRVLKINNRF